MHPNLTVLRDYALKSNPANLPPSILFSHTDKSLTIFDAYPKSTFHFLILPRANAWSPLTVFDLADLRTLLKRDKARAKEVLLSLKEDAESLKAKVEEEMVSRYGFKWEIWTGFHAVQSMEHLHLHVLSADLCSPRLKNKKHYNTFHPKLGFFLDLDEVLSWLDAEPSYYSTISELKKSQYEPLLKQDLSCFRCGEEFKTMPKLKDHLQEEWDKEAKREKAKLEKKRKREEEEGDASKSLETIDKDSRPEKKSREQSES